MLLFVNKNIQDIVLSRHNYRVAYSEMSMIK
jgi:hypothetical protein